MLTENQMRQRVIDAFPDAYIQLEDLTGRGDHFSLQIVSTHFDGLSLVQRHRLVYDKLPELRAGSLHALALETKTPQELPRHAGEPE